MTFDEFAYRQSIREACRRQELAKEGKGREKRPDPDW